MITEYEEGTSFPGVTGRTVDESSPAWPAPTRAAEGAPNILFFVLDDVGYGQLSCFGGLVETPNIDRVAARGLRYANMHTTALNSPTRSAFTGTIHSVTYDRSGELIGDDEAELARLMAQQ